MNTIIRQRIMNVWLNRAIAHDMAEVDIVAHIHCKTSRRCVSMVGRTTGTATRTLWAPAHDNAQMLRISWSAVTGDEAAMPPMSTTPVQDRDHAFGHRLAVKSADPWLEHGMKSISTNP